MELREYQERAMSTCTESSSNFGYMMLNLVGEVGEFASKVAKAIRKEKIGICDNEIMDEGFFGNDKSKENVLKNAEEREVFEVELRKEAGDILWQLAGLCSVMGWRLEDIAEANLAKLASRKKRGVIVGDGDNR